MIFKDGSADSPTPYDGPRDASGLVGLIMKLIGPASVHLGDAEAVQDFMKQAPAIVGIFQGESDDEFEVYQKAGDSLKGEATFGHSFDPSHVDLCNDKSACDSATLFIVDSDKELTSKFPGNFDVEEIKEWVSNMSAPKLVELNR